MKEYKLKLETKEKQNLAATFTHNLAGIIVANKHKLNFAGIITEHKCELSLRLIVLAGRKIANAVSLNGSGYYPSRSFFSSKN